MEKVIKKKGNKKSNGLVEKLYPVAMEAITWRKTRNYKEKTISIFDTEKRKKEASSGEKKSGSQPVNNSLASFRHQRGRNSTDPRPANACTNSCG